MLEEVVFADRNDAGERLAEALAEARVLDDPAPIVLGIPRGGVSVATVVADRLGLELDVVVPRKLGAPGNPELAIGAVAIDGTTVIASTMLEGLDVPSLYIEREIMRQREEIARRLQLYRGEPDELDPLGRSCIVVDDGLATGATAEAACRSLKARRAARVVLAVPVGSSQGLDRLRGACDDLVCVQAPRDFVAVGQWYREFDQVTDEEVLAILRGRHYHPAP